MLKHQPFVLDNDVQW